MSEEEDNKNSGNNGEIRKELKEFLSELEAKKEGESLVEKEEKEGEKDSENNVTIKKSDAVLIKVKDSLVNLKGRDFRVIGRDIHIFKRVEVVLPKEIKKILVLSLLLGLVFIAGVLILIKDYSLWPQKETRSLSRKKKGRV